MTDPQHADTDRRLAAAMASFEGDHHPDDDRWSAIEDGVSSLPDGQGRPPRPRLAVGLAAAAAIVVGLVIVAGSIGISGEGYEVGSNAADQPTSAPDTTVPDAPQTTPGPEAVRDCLDDRGIAYEVEDLEEGEGFALSPPTGATEDQRDAFTEGIEACRPDVSPSADDVADGQTYAARMETCLEGAGYDPVLTESSLGGYDIANGPDGTQAGFSEAIEACAREVEQAE